MTFEDIFYKYYELVVGYIMHILKNQTIAEEIAQDVFIRLYNYGFENVKYIKPWLYKTAIFLSYNYLRSEKKHTKVKENLINLELDTLTQNPDDVYINKENKNEINQVLNQMTDTEKSILQLKYNGFKYKEIAKITGININSVGKTLSRAREKFFMLYEKDRR